MRIPTSEQKVGRACPLMDIEAVIADAMNMANQRARNHGKHDLAGIVTFLRSAEQSKNTLRRA